MAKRFIDTKIWDKAWFRKLSVNGKLLWVYILTKCDHAGILDADWEAASFFIGYNISEYEEIPDQIKHKMISIEDDQFFIPSFIEYQYGALRINSKPHLSVIKRLEEKGLNNYLQKSLVSLKDKDKEKDIDKREDKFIEKVNSIIKEKKYSNEETDNFVGFWTERNTSNTKMRFELQQTFDIGRRLSTWVKNNKDWKIKDKKVKNERKEMQFTGR
ncbi:MAG: hypothetical protein Unbinned6747contig1000_24 [Prokaryotic dsDNA virus sp.]|nr:MAG: hypothetical protein Unbinned6747contig1000_24 [Prokaryotic dsDNA virus sp.]|tara:strand:+ start:16836 stop:17480 length:645 start_codon:yes stop_codon:yes gene_type:complete